jgi:hypothetical protein
MASYIEAISITTPWFKSVYRNYDDARKAYLNALKYDPANQNVLRDLGQLQI